MRRGAYTHTVWFSPYFNPRAPCGARLVALHKGGGKPGISIHALREGCDLRSALGLFGSEGISIHAPHAGRDVETYVLISRKLLFQSTRPVRGATSGIGISSAAIVFQSTRPVRGATVPVIPISVWTVISIHAPHAGRDGLLRRYVSAMRYFNPRAPCGARLRPVRSLSLTQNFNPRAPCGARPRLPVSYRCDP